MTEETYFEKRQRIWKKHLELAKCSDEVLEVDKVPGNNWLFCVNCGKAMMVLKNDLDIVAREHDNLCCSDVYACESCGNKTAMSSKRWY